MPLDQIYRTVLQTLTGSPDLRLLSHIQKSDLATRLTRELTNLQTAEAAYLERERTGLEHFIPA